MAYEEALVNISTQAGADLSGSQYLAVAVGAGGAAVAGAGVAADGILQNKPGNGEVAAIGVRGVSKCVFGATVARGALVAVDAAGKIITAAGIGTAVIGRCMLGGAADDIGSVLLDTKDKIIA